MRIILNILYILLFISVFTAEASAFWMWTPESGKFVNPKYSVKETPQEQMEHALGFYDTKEYKEAIRELKKLIKHYPKARQAPEAQYYIGKIAYDEGDLFKAFKEYQVVIDKYPFSDRSTEIVKLQYEIGETILEGTKKRNKFIDTMSGANYDLIEILRQVIKNAPYGEYAPPAQYKIGLYLLEKGLYPEARDEFEKVINDYPDSEWVKAAQYQIAVADSKRSTSAQYEQKITQAAVEEFEDFVEIYPNAELSKQAKDQIMLLKEKEAENQFLVASYYEKRKKYGAAKLYYQRVVDEYGATSWGKKALLKVQEISSKVN